MAVPSVETNFADLLDPRFQKIFNDRYTQLEDRLGDFYDMVSGADAPTKDTYRMSQVGTFGDVPEFTGTISYDDVNVGYKSTLTHKEYATGFQIERKLFDDDLFGIMDSKPRGLATALQRTRQKHGASLFNNAFSIDSTWNNFTEGVPLCSTAHTTTAQGVSTSVGFSNRITAALSTVSVAAARIQMRGFRGDRGERISIQPDKLIYPINLYQVAYEIIESEGQPDSANNNKNVHKGGYTGVDWEYISDTNDWWMADSGTMKDMLKFVDRVKAEFGMVEDFDTLIGKWRLYARYSLGYNDWRFILGSQVS
jgi:phage major head subunit gpT-like protein